MPSFSASASISWQTAGLFHLQGLFVNIKVFWDALNLHLEGGQVLEHALKGRVFILLESILAYLVPLQNAGVFLFISGKHTKYLGEMGAL